MESTIDHVPDDLVLWNLHQALAGAGVKKSAWYQMVKEGTAPSPVKVTAKRVAWVKAEVLAFRQRLIDQRYQAMKMPTPYARAADTRKPSTFREADDAV